MSDERSNRLANETSPYLLQHAHNPVDWYPWGEEGLERAKREDKPILLSIGYAACHWCHVMERESFEDPQTAADMNANFVSIKVDREERPDIDAVYMDAVQAMTGRGGWPLTAFLTPDAKPFYAGTYFPNEDRHGMPAFRKVLAAVSGAWRERRGEVEEQGGRIVRAMARAGEVPGSNDPLSEDVLRQGFAELMRTFDHRWGGFGGAPKFPQPMTLEFLLRCHSRGYEGALDMLKTTLDRMASGGIYDHIGGGFHRYATDSIWHVPHFEKMLYDNAQLARLYTRAWQATDDDGYRRVAVETCEYLLREMQHPEGGFFSSQDADSEGVEGKFFVWSYEALVGAGGEALAARFGATSEGNWEGTNILWLPLPAEAEPALGADDLATARGRLFEEREERVHPATDDKILASWNAMAISALAEAGRALGEPAYVDAAVRAADFVLTHLRDDHRRLLRAWRNGRAGGPAYADDHALLAEALLTLYETTFELRFFLEARSTADELVRLFWDEARGGFFQTGSDAEALVVRPKELYDNAVPSGNSSAADVLQRLAHLTGEELYERAAESALRLVRDQMIGTPTGFGEALSALDLHLGPVREVAVVGDPEANDTRALAAEVTTKRFVPNHVLAVAAEGDRDSKEAVELLRDRDMLNGVATAYVCERFVCQLPVTRPEALAEQLVGVRKS